MCEYILPLNYLWLKNFLTVQIYSSDMVELFTEVYNWLPLAHLINNKVMVGNVVLLSKIFHPPFPVLNGLGLLCQFSGHAWRVV
jgi:hypothetical protein